MGEKKRCHVCGRKMKDNVAVCKVCGADADEFVKAEFSGTHHVNKLAHPLINFIITNKRILLFENLRGTGSMVGTSQGGLLGGLIGGGADKLVQSTLGSNGSLKQQFLISDIEDISAEMVKNEIRLTIKAAGQKKDCVVTLVNPENNLSMSKEELQAAINS